LSFSYFISFSSALASFAEARLTYSNELNPRTPADISAVLFTVTKRVASEICDVNRFANIPIN